MSRKAQLSIEYIATYGWAFLSILIAIGAMTYAGVFNVGAYREAACLLPPGLICEDYELSTADDNIKLIIRNNHPVAITITDLDVYEGGFDFATCNIGGGLTLAADEEVASPIECALADPALNGQYVDLTIEGTFEQASATSPYEHEINGVLRGPFR